MSTEVRATQHQRARQSALLDLSPLVRAETVPSLGLEAERLDGHLRRRNVGVERSGHSLPVGCEVPNPPLGDDAQHLEIRRLFVTSPNPERGLEMQHHALRLMIDEVGWQHGHGDRRHERLRVRHPQTTPEGVLDARQLEGRPARQVNAQTLEQRTLARRAAQLRGRRPQLEPCTFIRHLERRRTQANACQSGHSRDDPRGVGSDPAKETYGKAQRVSCALGARPAWREAHDETPRHIGRVRTIGGLGRTPHRFEPVRVGAHRPMRAAPSPPGRGQGARSRAAHVPQRVAQRTP